jgi:hypothetical protein
LAAITGNISQALQKAKDAFATYRTNEQNALKIPAYYAACAKGASTLASTQADITFGLGGRENGAAGSLSRLNTGGGSVWAAWRLPLVVLGTMTDAASGKAPQINYDAINAAKIQYLMLGGAIRYDDDARFLTGNATTPAIQANDLDIWTGLEWYGSWLRFGGQYGYADVRARSTTYDKFSQSGSRWLVNSSIQLGSTSFWIGASYGNAGGTTTKLNDRTFILTMYFSPPSPQSLFTDSASPPGGNSPSDGGGANPFASPPASQ